VKEILDLGKLIDPDEFQKYVVEADKLETIIHRYGTVTAIPDYPCWMQYHNEGNVTGSISFTRNTQKHPVLKEMVLKICDIYRTIFPEYIPVLNERVHLLKTVGSIVVHKDEAGRNSCINVGLKNSSGAITKISTDGLRQNFDKNHYSIQTVDGHGYLLNTNQFHSVEGLSNQPRYLITYGFSEKFDVLQKEFTGK